MLNLRCGVSSQSGSSSIVLLVANTFIFSESLTKAKGIYSSYTKYSVSLQRVGQEALPLLSRPFDPLDSVMISKRWIRQVARKHTWSGSVVVDCYQPRIESNSWFCWHFWVSTTLGGVFECVQGEAWCGQRLPATFFFAEMTGSSLRKTSTTALPGERRQA